MELPIDITDTRDFQILQRDASTVTKKRVTFYLGTHGPFVEYYTDDEYHGGEPERRVARLRATIERQAAS